MKGEGVIALPLHQLSFWPISSPVAPQPLPLVCAGVCAEQAWYRDAQPEAAELTPRRAQLPRAQFERGALRPV